MAWGLRLFYFLGTSLFLCLVAPFFLLHSRGRLRLAERFGSWGQLPDEFIWLHGASAGEVSGLLLLVPALRERFKNVPILLSSISIHGIDRASQQVDYIRLAPFDHPLCIARALSGRKPVIYCFAETELWPETLLYLQSSRTEVFMLNATISDFTTGHYQRWRALFKKALQQIAHVCAANQKSLERFVALGVANSHITVTGNSKYESQPSIQSAAEALSWKAKFNFDTHPVVTLGSLRPGEEEFWLKAYAGQKIKFNLILAPRHAEKFNYFKERLSALKTPFVCWSEQERWPAGQNSLVLLDGMGVLEKVYSFSDLAFIGATLVPKIGGHNPLEAAAYGCFVAVGPHHNKIQGIVEELLEQRACAIVESQVCVNRLLNNLTTQPEQFKSGGQRGRVVWEQQQGASARIIEIITASKASKAAA